MRRRPIQRDEIAHILQSAYPAWMSASEVACHSTCLTPSEAAGVLKQMNEVEKMKMKNNLSMYRMRGNDK